MENNQITVEQIDPATARRYLGANRDNRKVKRGRVATYARQMTQGQWLVTGDPVRFDADGRLLDGQHRLLAIVESETTQTMVVIRDLPPESFQVIDSGLPRTFADALGVGVPSPLAKAAVARLMFVVDVGGDPRLSTDMSIVSRTDVHDYYHGHAAEIDFAVSSGFRLRKAIPGQNSTGWGAFVILARRASVEWSEEYIEGVLTGVNLGAGDPRLALRSWMTNQRGDGFPTAGWHAGLFIKAWNKWMDGETAQLLSLRAEEQFPIPRTVRRLRSAS